jgi:hypothetical protein
MQSPPTFNFGQASTFYGCLTHTQYAAKNQKPSKLGSFDKNIDFIF